MLFIKINVNEDVSHVLNYFGLSANDAPVLRLINTNTTKKYAMAEETITKDSIKTFCQGVLDGTIKVNKALV